MSKVVAINSDIMEFDKAPQYDVAWTDPPWGNSMVKFFETVQKKQTGVETKNTLSDIISKLGILCSTEKPLYVEYSIHTYKEVVRILESHGHKLTRVDKRLMTNKKPYVILTFNSSVYPDDGLHGFSVTTNVVEKYPNPVVFDPFAGMGKTARAVIKGGGSYIGSELNAQRFQHLKNYADKANK